MTLDLPLIFTILMGVSILAYLSRRYDQPIPAAFALTHADGETSK
jgi:hypothetical protein